MSFPNLFLNLLNPILHEIEQPSLDFLLQIPVILQQINRFINTLLAIFLIWIVNYFKNLQILDLLWDLLENFFRLQNLFLYLLLINNDIYHIYLVIAYILANHSIFFIFQINLRVIKLVAPNYDCCTLITFIHNQFLVAWEYFK